MYFNLVATLARRPTVSSTCVKMHEKILNVAIENKVSGQIIFLLLPIQRVAVFC